MLKSSARHSKSWLIHWMTASMLFGALLRESDAQTPDFSDLAPLAESEALVPLFAGDYVDEPNGSLSVIQNGVQYPLMGSQYFTDGKRLEDLRPYSDAGLIDGRFVTINGEKYANPRFLLPPPAQANDHFYSPFRERPINMGAAKSYFNSENTEAERDKLLLSFRAKAQVGMYYDTSLFSGDQNKFLNPAGVSLDGRNIVGAGQTYFFDNNKVATYPVSVSTNNQIMDFLGLGKQVQFYAEGTNYFRSDQFDLKHVYLRAWDKGNWSVLFGRSNSLFEVGEENLPAGLLDTYQLVGTSALGRTEDQFNNTQIRLLYKVVSADESQSWDFSIAAENPRFYQFTVPNSFTELTRWPALSSRFKYDGKINDRYKMMFQCSALLRSITVETADLVESSDAAWGISTFAELDNMDNTSAFYIGVAGGEGISEYISGVSVSAMGGGSTPFSTISGIGAYVGFRKEFWGPTVAFNGAEQPNWATNIAYGYAHTETPKGFSADKNSEVQQAWVNIVKHVNPNVVIGGEYQFAKRTVGSGDSGENHRFMIVLALTSQPPESAAADPLITFEASQNAKSVQRFETLRQLYHLDEKPAYSQGL